MLEPVISRLALAPWCQRAYGCILILRGSLPTCNSAVAGCSCPVAGCNVLLVGHVLQLQGGGGQLAQKGVHEPAHMYTLTCPPSLLCLLRFPPLCSPPALLTACLTPGPRLQPLPWALLTCLSPWASLHLSPSHCLACVAVSSSLFPLLSPSLAFLCDGPVGGCQGARQQCREAGAGVP